MTNSKKPVETVLVALPECSSSVLYGLYDILNSVGNAWSAITGERPAHPGFRVRIAAPGRDMFRCDGGVPVAPDVSFADRPRADLILVPDLAISNQEDPRGKWDDCTDWLREAFAGGAVIGTVCTGSVLLAMAGLLNGKEATTHWAFVDLFKTYFPEVKLRPERIVVRADPQERIITTGGTASWNELTLYLVNRFCGEAEAARTAKVYLMGDRSDGQLPYAVMPKPRPHDDAAIGACQEWIADNYAAANPVSRMAERSGLAERTFKRRFRAATGFTPVDYVQTLRIEEAKQLLETTTEPTEQIGAAVGYEDPAFFRRLFKRKTGITPARYRQKFRAVGSLESRAATS